MNKTKGTILIIILYSCFASSYGYAEFVVDQIETLRGLDNIGIVIDDLDSMAVKLGLSKKKLEEKVKSKLRSAKIKVSRDYKSYLYIKVSTQYEESIDALSFNITLRIYQEVYLDRYPMRSFNTPTWGKSHVGFIARVFFVKTVLHNINILVDKFIGEYRSENSKPKQSSEGFFFP